MAVSKVILNGETLIDVTQKTVTPSNMLSGITALKNDGTDITGSIAAKSAADLITSGSQVTVPSGMYAAAASTAIASGSIKALGLSINPGIGVFSLDSSTGVVTIDRPKASGTVYATITSAGYLDATASDSDIVTIPSNSKMYALPTVSAGIITPTEFSQVAVVSGKFTTGSITVAAIPSSYVGSNVPRRTSSDVVVTTLSFSSNSRYDYIDSTVAWSSGFYENDGRKSYLKNILDVQELPSQSAITIAPTESSQIAVASRRWLKGDVTVAAISSSYVGSAIARRGAADLTASGSVITVPSGYYTANVSKAVAAGSITIPSHDFDIKPDITLNSATGKIDLWKSLSYTIPVSLTSGYIAQASGPRVAATVDSSYQLPVKAAATIVPSTADQVVASGYFLTGAQTVKGDSALIPSNIAAGVSIFGIEGTHQGGGNYQVKTVSPTGETQVVLPDTAYDALSSVTVEAAALQSKVVTPAATSQIISADSSYYGLSQVTVEPIATTSYYLAQDSQGYITYSSIMPSGGEYYIFDVAGIKHIESN